MYNLSAIIDRYKADVATRAASAQGPMADVVHSAVNTPLPAMLTPDMTLDQARRVPHAVYEGGKYGSVTSLLIPLGANLDVLALNRPVNMRVFLLIFNPTVANIFVAFDQQASLGSLPIPAGGNLFFDNFVPQNDIHIFGANAANIPVFYSNIDVSA